MQVPKSSLKETFFKLMTTAEDKETIVGVSIYRDN
jgi:hypothetical protein